MTEIKYSAPIDGLFELGEKVRLRNWPDYLGMGFTAGHIPELIGLACDSSLLNGQENEFYAVIHAWRVLGKLKATEAIDPLIGILHWVEKYDMDWVLEEMPRVFSLIGPESLPALGRYLCDTNQPEYARVAAQSSIEKIGKEHPDSLQDCIAVLRKVLLQYQQNTDTINGFIISSLAHFDDVESLPLMEKAFSEDKVDISIDGDWEDIQIQMGLLKERSSPRPKPFDFAFRPLPVERQPRYRIVETQSVSPDTSEDEEFYEDAKVNLQKRRKRAKKAQKKR